MTGRGCRGRQLTGFDVGVWHAGRLHAPHPELAKQAALLGPLLLRGLDTRRRFPGRELLGQLPVGDHPGADPRVLHSLVDVVRMLSIEPAVE